MFWVFHQFLDHKNLEPYSMDSTNQHSLLEGTSWLLLYPFDDFSSLSLNCKYIMFITKKIVFVLHLLELSLSDKYQMFSCFVTAHPLFLLCILLVSIHCHFEAECSSQDHLKQLVIVMINQQLYSNHLLRYTETKLTTTSTKILNILHTE